MENIILEMPMINFQATKQKINDKINEYNEGLPLSEQIRGSHFETLWRIVEHFAYKIITDNKNIHPNLRRITLEHPERILWTSKLSRENIREWMHVNCLRTITRRLQRLEKSGFIFLTKRSENKKHITSVIALNKEFIALEDALCHSRSNHTQMSIKTRSNELKNDVKIMKNRFIENQQVSPKIGTSCPPLLSITDNTNLNNKLIQNGAFSGTPEKGVLVIPNFSNSANPSPFTPKQENVSKVAKENHRKYAEKIHGKKVKTGKYEVYADLSDAQKLEQYRRAMSEYVFREALKLWEHRNDVYDGEYRKAAAYVAENFFRDEFFNSTERIFQGVKRALWCIKFQYGQRKTSKLEESKEQFIFFPYKYFSETGPGTFDGLRKYYSLYEKGHKLSPAERAIKRIKPTKVQKNFSKEIIAIKPYVDKFFFGKRNVKSLAALEREIKKKYPNNKKYLAQFKKMTSGHFVH